MIGGHDHVGKMVARKSAGPNRNGLLAKILNRGALGARQRRTRRAAVVERRQRAVLERMLTRPLGTVKPRHQPSVGVERVGAKTANGAVNIKLPRNAALVTGEPLVANLVIGDVVPGTAFEDAVLGKTNNAILGMELGIHALNDIANQRRLVIELTEGPQYPVSVTMASQRKVLPTPDARGKVRVVDLVFNRAASGHMFPRAQPLVGDFHLRETRKRQR